MSTTLGVFETTGIRALIDAQRIVPGKNFSLDHINNASLDITIGDELYEVDCIIKPRQNKERVRDLLPIMGARKHSFNEPLRAGKSYLARSSIGVNFPPGMYGYANPKSSSGRLFVYTRLLVDFMPGFDCIDMRTQGLTGDVWLAIEPLCFDILPSTKERYTQLCIFNGDARFSNADLLHLLETKDLLYRTETQQPYTQQDLSLFTHNGAVQMTLAARGTEPVGYRAKCTHEGVPPLNLEERNIDPRPYFEPVYAEQRVPGDEHSWGVWLEAGKHYLLSTHEMVKVPETIAYVLKELDGRNGDAVVHFAGFVDPGFFGAITLEARSPRRVFLRNKSPIVTGVLEKMQRPAETYTGSYHSYTGAKLPKQFGSFT